MGFLPTTGRQMIAQVQPLIVHATTMSFLSSLDFLVLGVDLLLKPLLVLLYFVT